MLILIKYWKNIIILFSIICCFICYYIGKSKATKTIEIKKIIDEEATRKAIELERIKILSQLREVKIKDTVKSSDGTIKTHEVTKIEKNNIKTDEINKIEFDENKKHSIENITSKIDSNDFIFSSSFGLRKNNLREIHQNNDVSFYTSLTLQKNWNSYLSSYLFAQYLDVNSSQSPISLDIGFIKFEAKF